MKLTPLDIRHKEFKRGMRGYADVEVDEFLDEIADEYERLFKDNIDLQDRVESLEEKVAGYKRIEETLQKTLVNAQASAEEQKQNANKQAQLILQDAELKSRQMVNEAYSERQSIEQSMAKLKSAEEDFRFKFRQLLDGYSRQLQEQPEVSATAAAPAAADFSRHAEAIKEAIARESVPEAASTPERTEAPEPAPQVAASAPESEPEAPRAPMPDRPAVPPERGRGGVQAGTHAEPAPEPSGEAEPEPDDTMSQPARPAADDPEIQAAQPGDAPDEADEDQPRRRERILFGESDDLLADVDTGVNENEFKW
jgi:cell division initiation protein